MSDDPTITEYGSIRLTHHAETRERDAAMKRRRGRRAASPECVVIGHAWTEEPGRDAGAICIVCQVVRFD